MGSRSKQGPRTFEGVFVTCEECKVKVEGTERTLREFIEAHQVEEPSHEIRVWIPVERG